MSDEGPWEANTTASRLALRLWHEMERIEVATYDRARETELAAQYRWCIEVAEVLQDELKKEARENPAELAGYLPRHVQVWANLGLMRKSDETG